MTVQGGSSKVVSLADLNKAIARNNDLLVTISDVVIGLTRDQYARNVLAVEQDPTAVDFLTRINEQLMDRMVEIFVEKMKIEGKVPPGISDFDLLVGVRKSLEGSVDEYLRGLWSATSEG